MERAGALGGWPRHGGGVTLGDVGAAELVELDLSVRKVSPHDPATINQRRKVLQWSVTREMERGLPVTQMGEVAVASLYSKMSQARVLSHRFQVSTPR